MKPRKRSIAALCAIFTIVVVVAAGCGGSTKESPGGPVTLTVWDITTDPTTPPGKARTQVDQLFMKKHPNIKVEHVGFPYNAYWPTKVQSVISSRRGPDVMMVYPNRAFYKGLWPLKELVDSSPLRRSLLWFGWDSQDPAIHQIPWSTYAYGFMFNKAMFKKAGLDENAPPTTWSELLQSCQKLSEAGVTPIAAGFKDGFYGDWLVSYGIASRLFSKDDLQKWYSNRLGWDTPQMRHALELFLELKKAHCFAAGSEGKSLSDVHTDFLGKRAAMEYNTLGGYADYAKALGAKNVGVFRMPVLPGQVYDGQPVDSGANNGYAITRFTKHCSAAWEYLSFILGPEAQRISYETGTIYPNNTSVTAKAKDPLDTQVLGWLKDPNSHTGPAELGSEATVAAEKGYPQMIAGRMSVDQFIEKVQAVRQQTEPPITSTSDSSAPACN